MNHPHRKANNGLIRNAGISDFIGQPDDAFRAAAKRVMEKNTELYRRLS